MTESASKTLRGACVLGLASGAMLAALLAAFGAPLLHFLAVVLVVGICLPLLLGATIAAGLGPRAGRWRRVRSSLVASACAALCFLAVQIPGFVVGKLVNAAHVTEAKAWCEGLATKLERWRDEHGSYPATLEASAFVVDPPRMCRSDLIYVVRDGVFTLDFPTHETIFSAWYYRSDERSWKRYS